jgi:hypothetical protein
MIYLLLKMAQIPKWSINQGAIPAVALHKMDYSIKQPSRIKRRKKAELVKVYEKIKPGIWVYNDLFKLVDSWREMSNARNVFKFRLELCEDHEFINGVNVGEIDHNRLIPTSVKLEVWKRDKGRCVKCGCQDNLHFDHIIPYSKGGSSLVAENIQILCARHNIAKRDKIE